MTVKEMQSIAAETLTFFVQTMPDCPFGVDGVEVEFTTKKKEPERFRAQCQEFSPDRPINGYHLHALEYQTLHHCLTHLYEHMQIEKSWKITEEFILDLRSKYIAFMAMNSIYLGAI